MLTEVTTIQTLKFNIKISDKHPMTVIKVYQQISWTEKNIEGWNISENLLCDKGDITNQTFK